MKTSGQTFGLTFFIEPILYQGRFERKRKGLPMANANQAPYITIASLATGEYEEKKSRFIAQIAPVSSEEEALLFLDEVRAAHRMARHNVYAYILAGEGDSARIRYSDDGEPQKTAGLPVLEVLNHAGLSDVIAVVTRYFGGTLLGTGGLVRAYTKATQLAVEAAQLLTYSLCVDLKITTEYARYEKLLRLVSAAQGKVLSSDFGQVVEVDARFRAEDAEAFLRGLQELERGRAQIVQGEPEYLVF